MTFAGPDAQHPSPAFWALIERARADPAAAATAIAALGSAELADFYWTYEAATEPLRDCEIPPGEPLPSEDGLADVVAWAVAQGEAYYRDLLDGRRVLPTESPSPPDLQSQAGLRYEALVGEPLPTPPDRP